jgi:hypothetical protein
LLGHASVQTTERYLGCKQNLGSPVNDRFKLRLDVQPQDVNVESAMVKGSTPVETAPCKGIERRDGGHADEQPVEAKRLFQPERTDLVEVRKVIARTAFDAALGWELHRVIQKTKK